MTLPVQHIKEDSLYRLSKLLTVSLLGSCWTGIFNHAVLGPVDSTDHQINLGPRGHFNMKPTEDQIQAEIKALQECKKYAPHFTAFGDDNHRKLDLQIEYLRGGIDTTADEWEDFSFDEQSAIEEAQAWEEGQGEEAPSKGWDTFKPK